ncbi:AP-5 complex subunit zeta-1 isoform X8 [Rhinopithecus roxellana]|uniref:AP-5 complex subunit zeta-1 isoform X8 n=1 Tax=Rhinopithecus roxellana TaxID=61622 RepID=UPI0012376BE0|nr:AP-5 complex subunit zeta-1 isoform X8 [Rhinopithecus roxellana]XP_030788870.1 AP-5 complex subunit zeta-1 isoform X8 [Rhinopithecus roxellana]
MRRSVLWARVCCEHWRAGSLRGPASDTSSPSWPRSWSSARAPSRRTRPPCSASGWLTGCAMLASSKGSRTPAASSPRPGPGSLGPSTHPRLSFPQPGPITEVDGAVATDFFTVLSTGHRFTEDQWLNVQAFSMLRAWLLHSGPEGLGILDTDDRSEQEGSTLSVISATSSAGRLLPPRERLREVAFEYCQRLIEQSNRRALRKGDSDLQKACLVEAVLVLDVLCRQDPSFLYRSLSCLKTLHGRVRGDPASVRVLLPLARFFLSHGEAAAVDSEAVYQHLFTRIPLEQFHSPMLAFEFVQFCRDNLHLFGGHLGTLRLSFPNLFKFLAWNSPPLTSEFVALLPALVDAGTALEMLHALLDLPCLTAVLDLQLRSLPASSERPLWDTSLRAPSCLEAFRDPKFQGLFQYLLRPKASGATERLVPLYQLLQPMAGCARVAQCAEAVPTLLQTFFSAVTQVADGALINQLALLLLGRSDSLYPAPGYAARVHSVLSSQFLALCTLKPSLVVELARDLLEFLGSVNGLRSRASLVTSVVSPQGGHCADDHTDEAGLPEPRPDPQVPGRGGREASWLSWGRDVASEVFPSRCLEMMAAAQGLSVAVKDEDPDSESSHQLHAQQGGCGSHLHPGHGAADPAEDAQCGPVCAHTQHGGVQPPISPRCQHGPAPGLAHGQPAGGEGGRPPAGMKGQRPGTPVQMKRVRESWERRQGPGWAWHPQRPMGLAPAHPLGFVSEPFSPRQR